MSLFINDNLRPDIYKNQCHIIEPNQSYFHKDRVSDMMSEQAAIHQTFSDKFDELKAYYHNAEQINTDNWQQIAQGLREIRTREQEHENFEQEVFTRLSNLDYHNQQLQQILNQDDALKEDLSKRLEVSEASNQRIIRYMESISEANDHMQKEFQEYKQVHDDMFRRLENQEAVLEKIQRQLNEFRAFLYERSHYLVEKIEDSYQLTSSYIYKLVAGMNKPVTWYIDQRKLSQNKQDD